MKVVLFAPNGGISLSQGGGSNFVLKQARALARLGHDVVLAGFHAWPLDRLEREHGVALDAVRSKVRLSHGPGGTSYQAQRRLPGKPSPYFALADPRVGRWMRSMLAEERPEVAWFHDDVPRAARGAAPRARRMLYVHFPLLARSAAIIPALRRTRSRGEASQDAILRRLASRLVETHPGEDIEALQANSRVTAEACRKIWGRVPEVVPTYAPVASPGLERRVPEVLSVAAFQRGKNLTTVLEAFRKTRGAEGRLTLFGLARDPGYLAALRRMASDDPRVRFSVDAPRAELVEALGRARGIISAAEFEPFGLSLLEGMASGLTPLVAASPWSGAWTDLLDEGRRGTGFRDVPGLTEALERLLAAPNPGPDPSALRTAELFSEQRLMAQLGSILG